MPRASFRASPTSSGANRLMVQGLSVATRVGSSPGRRRANSASSRAWRASAQAVRRSNPTIASISCASDKPSACWVSVSISRANNPDGLVLPKVRSSPPWRRSRSISAHANPSSSSVSSSVSSPVSSGATGSSAIASDPHPASNMCSILTSCDRDRKVIERAPTAFGIAAPGGRSSSMTRPIPQCQPARHRTRGVARTEQGIAAREAQVCARTGSGPGRDGAPPRHPGRPAVAADVFCE